LIVSIFYNSSVKALWRSLRRIFYDCLGQTRTILTSSFALMRQNCVPKWSQMRMTMNLKTGMNYDDVLKHKHLIWFLLLLYSMPITEMFLPKCMCWLTLVCPPDTSSYVIVVPKVYPSYASVCFYQCLSFNCMQALRRVYAVA